MPKPHFHRLGRQLCAVNVKLTICLAIGADVLVSAHSISRAGFIEVPARLLHGRCQRGLVIARGGVGMSPGFPGVEDQDKRGTAFSEPSLFVLSPSSFVF